MNRAGILLTIAGVTGLAFAMGGGSAKSTSPRPRPGRRPWQNKITIPGVTAGWEAVDEALCLCLEAGTRATTLALCVLRRVWPEVPWPAGKSDHASVGATSKAVFARATRFLDAVNRGERPCDPVEVEPGDVVGPGGEEPERPEPEPVDDDPFSDGAERQKFARVVGGSNPTKLVRAALGGVPATDARVRRALQCMACTGFNLYLYSRPRSPGDLSGGECKIGGKWFDIGPAWLPKNQDLRATYANGAKPLRQVSWSGNPIAGGPTSYGAPWLAFDGDGACVGVDPWDPKRNPPSAVLARFGLELQTMRAIWEAANL